MRPGPWRQKGKWVVLGVMATAIVTAAALDDSDEKQKAVAARASPHQPDRAAVQSVEERQPSNEARVELERMMLKAEAEAQPEIGNVFEASSWYVPPPPPPPPPPPLPPKPTAPPLPFTYLGSYDDASSQIVILARGDRVYTVAEGDLVDDIYRVESVKAGMIQFTYLPLRIRQSIMTGGSL